jgi:hypothetical protein
MIHAIMPVRRLSTCGSRRVGGAFDAVPYLVAGSSITSPTLARTGRFHKVYLVRPVRSHRFPVRKAAPFPQVER